MTPTRSEKPGRSKKQRIDPSYRNGKSPETDAWITLFFIENHLDYFGYPEMVASPEQIRFLVFIENDERYYPCTDRTFETITRRKRPNFLTKRYNDILQKILALIDDINLAPYEKNQLENLIRIKFGHETRDKLMLPSRIEKRLLRIFLTWSQIEDPWLYEKGRRNQRADAVLQSEALQNALNRVDTSTFRTSQTLSAMKQKIECLKFLRLIALTAEHSLWESNAGATFSDAQYLKLFNRPVTGAGMEPLLEFLGLNQSQEATEQGVSKKILWLAEEAGEIMFDLSVINFLTGLGHKVIIVFKDGPLFTKVDLRDAREDPILARELESAVFIEEKTLSKNDLVNILTSDNKVFVISDGTREDLNLLLTSTSFARIFKEVDGVISRGITQRSRLFDTHFQFTQDIFNISTETNKRLAVFYKAKHAAVIKYSHKALEGKARKIIEQMIQAKKQGMTVIFYSAIIGSIPGKIQIAKRIITVFIRHLEKNFAKTCIINPSEYYEPGMDADDLMYMWEIVQRSGYIDIWRFQTYSDIVQAFQIMGIKVPPEWVGKDATYSTGCTKEMKIALDVQRKHPEMQIIGPAKEKFMRRDEYGIGKMFDRRLSESSMSETSAA